MKKKLNKGLLLSLFSLLALTSCGGPTNSGNVNFGSSESEKEEIEENSSENNYVEDEEKEDSEVNNNDNNKEDENEKEEEIPPVDNSPKLMDHIIEVANNVDKTPTFMTELKQNKNQRRSYKDITDSSNHENYEIYLGMNGLTGSNMTSVVGANNFVEQMKQTKEEIITYREAEHDLFMDIRNGKYQKVDGSFADEFFEWQLVLSCGRRYRC